MTRIAAVLLLVLTAACGSLFRRSEDAPGAARLRLCVQNETVAYGNIIARANLVRFDVMPGQTECKQLSSASPSIALTARTTGGGRAGPLSYRATLQTGGFSCWVWKLSDSPASTADLVPCHLTEDGGTASSDSSRDPRR
jgi:hypothetical protein